MQKLSTKTLATLSMLIALEVVLSRFLSISTWNIKIGFSFVPIVAAAILLGPVYAGTAAALADVIGALLFPIGSYFPGFTLTAFLTGLVFGLFLHKRQSFPRIIGAVAVNQLLFSLLLNTLWISILYGSPYVPLLGTRAFQCALLSAVQLIVIPILARTLKHLKGKLI